jgi:hypothetical protein
MQPQLKLTTPDRSHGSKKNLPNDLQYHYLSMKIISELFTHFNRDM